ncbi:hypothetical protein R1sor_016918 [Riccia sorocarpa]|uniref:Uncharacterized protein n=1 Tax=Riccia sorocarpa TaxID=122646 RepID=A0ABD3HK96_9MARC
MRRLPGNSCTMRQDLQKPARRCVPRWADGAGEISRSKLGDASQGGLMAQARSPEASSEMVPRWADGAGEISRSQLGDASSGGLMAQARSPEARSEIRPQVG